MAAAYAARFAGAEGVGELQRIGQELTAAVKQRLVPRDLERVRRCYAQRLARLKPPPVERDPADPAGLVPEPARNGS
ncbi:MAG TPA: hypothetical protein VMB21_12370 [Candidatus Limnocylindria bacterium]|nr:hypothetical protein [Candidatus Limnocylindria bacterium]